MIEREDIDGVTVVRLAHGKVNALDLELLGAITETFTALDASHHRAIVFTGAGRAFSAGVDLWRILDGGPDYIRAFLPALSDAFLAVFTVGKPVVAAVGGHAIAGGAILVCACDRRIMADGPAGIGVTELLVGVPFPPAALEILAFAMGDRRGREAVVTAGVHPPREALERRYVDEVVAPEVLMERAVATAVDLATRIPADTYRLTKDQLRFPVRQRVARLRPVFDDRVAELWVRRVEDGWLRGFIEDVTARRPETHGRA